MVPVLHKYLNLIQDNIEPVSKRPILANLCVGLKFQSSKYSMYSSD